MVYVLAHIKFIEPHRAVVGESDVLGEDEVACHRSVAGVFQFHMPEPRRGGFCEHEAQLEIQVAPCSARRHAAVIYLIGSGAARA